MVKKSIIITLFLPPLFFCLHRMTQAQPKLELIKPVAQKMTLIQPTAEPTIDLPVITQEILFNIDSTNYQETSVTSINSYSITCTDCAGLNIQAQVDHHDEAGGAYLAWDNESTTNVHRKIYYSVQYYPCAQYEFYGTVLNLTSTTSESVTDHIPNDNFHMGYCPHFPGKLRFARSPIDTPTLDKDRGTYSGQITLTAELSPS